MKFDGFGPQEMYISVLFSIISKIMASIKAYEKYSPEKTSLDFTIIEKTKELERSLTKEIDEKEGKEELVNMNKLCRLYYRAAKLRDEDCMGSYEQISEKMRHEILNNDEVEVGNLVKHKRLLNSVSLRLEEVEKENEEIVKKMEIVEDKVNTFFYN
jgi:hypothetical protein